VTWALFLGATLGFGLCCCALALRPARPSLAEALARLGPTGVSVSPDGRARATTLALLTRLGSSSVDLQGDLRVVGRRDEALAAERLGIGLLGGLFAVVSTTAVDLAGVPVPLGLRLGGLLVLSVAGSFVPLATLKAAAAERRRQLRHSVAAYLDLAAVALSAGAGAEEALLEAAGMADAAGFPELRDALWRAERSGETPWDALARLGVDLGLHELCDLATTVRLVGTEGARARATLLARSHTLRRALLADSEGRAQRRAETSRVPLALQFVAFLVLIVYPPLVHLLGGF
jgi:Flp pilus assembly protein TadB